MGMAQAVTATAFCRDRTRCAQRSADCQVDDWLMIVIHANYKTAAATEKIPHQTISNTSQIALDFLRVVACPCSTLFTFRVCEAAVVDTFDDVCAASAGALTRDPTDARRLTLRLLFPSVALDCATSAAVPTFWVCRNCSRRFRCDDGCIDCRDDCALSTRTAAQSLLLRVIQLSLLLLLPPSRTHPDISRLIPPPNSSSLSELLLSLA